MAIRIWTSPAFGSAAVILFLAAFVVIAVRLVRDNRKDVLAAAPLVPEQKVLLPAGPVILAVEAPRLSVAYRALRFQVSDDGGRPVADLRYRMTTASGAVYGVTRVKVPFGRLTITHPGAFHVRASGLPPDQDPTAYRLVFTRPYLARLALQIIGLVLCFTGAFLALLRVLWLLGLMRKG